MEEGTQTTANERLRADDDAEAFADFGHERRDRVESGIDCARANVRHMDTVFAKLDMQGAGEMAEEGFGASIGAKTLCCHLRGYRAYIEDIPFAALPHVLTEEVTEHSRSVHMQVHDEARETFAVIEDVAIMIDPGIVNEYFDFDIVLMRVVI